MTSLALKWQSCALTHQGNVRDHNEDACLDHGESGLWVVADGMGGHEQGDYASRFIVDRLKTVAASERPSEFVDTIEERLLEANRHLFQRSMAGEQPTVIGSTVVALLAFDRFGLTTWAGDSRAYLLRGGNLERVSCDHSEVQNLVAQGLVRQEDAENHPKANVITRAVGGAEELYLDYELRHLESGDRYLLCSDGLYKDVDEREIAGELASGSCDDAARRLLELALSRSCRDNVTVVVVDFLAEGSSAGDPAEPGSEGDARNPGAAHGSGADEDRVPGD